MRLSPEQAAIIAAAVLPSPRGRGAGGEGTTLAANYTQPEPL